MTLAPSARLGPYEIVALHRPHFVTLHEVGESSSGPGLVVEKRARFDLRPGAT